MKVKNVDQKEIEIIGVYAEAYRSKKSLDIIYFVHGQLSYFNSEVGVDTILKSFSNVNEALDYVDEIDQQIHSTN